MSTSTRKRLSVILQLGGLVMAVALGVVLRFLVVQSAVIDSASMSPTLEPADRALIDKRPQTLAELKRGDIIVFRWDPADAKTTYVKRIIGLPGDTVQILYGKVIVNGESLTERYLKELPNPEIGSLVRLGADDFYVLGDNRNLSEDSRDLGTVARDNIIGKVVRVVWPLHRTGKMNEVF